MTLCSVLHISIYSRTSSVCRYHYYTATYIIGVQCLSTYVSHIGYFNYYVPLQHYICVPGLRILPLNVPSSFTLWVTDEDPWVETFDFEVNFQCCLQCYVYI